jgi:hypothetical protein
MYALRHQILMGGTVSQEKGEMEVMEETVSSGLEEMVATEEMVLMERGKVELVVVGLKEMDRMAMMEKQHNFD